MSVPQTPTPHQPLMVQAPVRALDPDGAAVITGGTAGFAIASLACWVGWEDLAARGDGWYLGVALTGLGLGVVAGPDGGTNSEGFEVGLGVPPGVLTRVLLSLIHI